jgi:hypothetical protein
MYDIRNKQITFNPMDGHHPSNIGNKASDHATNVSNQKQSLELPLNKSFYNYSFNHLSMLHIYIYICIYILQGPMFVKPVSCKKNGPFFGTA